MASYFKLIRTPYEEPYHLNLLVQASNGRQSGELEVYTTPEDLRGCGESLASFPAHAADSVLWEMGSERAQDPWAFYFRFHVILTAAAGECALHLRLNNNRQVPDLEVSEFCIARLEPSQVNRLGKLLCDYSRLEHEVLLWTVREGKLIRKSVGPEPAA